MQPARHLEAVTASPGRHVQHLLSRWLAERQDLMNRLCRLADALRRGHGRTKPQAELDRFCEVLVDYVSAGHFEVYRELLEQHARTGTEAALVFNDRYFRGGSAIALQRDLPVLGQRLASRFDCEDALIRCLQATPATLPA